MITYGAGSVRLTKVPWMQESPSTSLGRSSSDSRSRRIVRIPRHSYFAIQARVLDRTPHVASGRIPGPEFGSSAARSETGVAFGGPVIATPSAADVTAGNDDGFYYYGRWRPKLGLTYNVTL